MLQRIQSLYLALVVILGVLLLFLPVLSFTANEHHYVMNAYKTLQLDSLEVLSKNMGVGAIQGLVILISVIVIFLFKNRGLQMKVAKLNILLLALQIAAIVMYSDVVRKSIPDQDPADVAVHFEFACTIPLISLILTYLAVRAIKKDDDLVRSADRLR
ncbi:MAG: DUF4293 domain-containing protein [Flavobacteriales bacterium]|nr:DUF4293 domain-containing protein [Flavobacteriales bacterium]